jgi:hypothetical protein
MSGRVLALNLQDKAAVARRAVRGDHVVLAGWTGRDKAQDRARLAGGEAARARMTP